MKYIDVLLPLPLEGLFTYELPDEMVPHAERGMRAVVPLGRKKTYVGIVVEVHERKPEFDTKPALQLLDAAPIVTEEQYRLWQWIADYYMAPLGDVYAAAVPSALRSREGYKPKTETYVALAPALRDEPALHATLNKLTRTRARHKAFIDYLALSHWDSAFEAPAEQPVEVARDELMNFSHCSAPTLRALLDEKLLVAYEKEVGRLNHAGTPHPELIHPLNEAQAQALSDIDAAFGQHEVVLLHGVTSSGKTELYIHLIERALQRGEQVLYLLPEIALTVQIRQRLQRVFGSRLGIYHSKYSDAERAEIWQKQLSAEPYDVILGVRSSVFLPFRRLGLVIIDEEHETSFKQQDPSPRYHARSVAVVMARRAGAKVLLGTATPSAESYHNAMTGKYGLVKLTTRYKDLQLPEIQVVDIKDLQRRKLMSGPFSPTLLAAIREALERGEQAILFQNRRGFAPMMECHQCGWVPRCTNCDVSLTYHKNIRRLSCHYCGYTYAVPEVCPCCGSDDLKGRGYGTEKIEDRIMQLFPEARVARMDLDTTRTRAAQERIIDDFSAGRTNVLIGTQMVSKGLDFDRVAVVGILNADTMLNTPDFRAYEHAYMMMAQVSGRAGRKGRRGLVVLQTKSPQLPVIGQVVRNDYDAFYGDLMEERLAFRYPPYYHIIYVYLRHRHEPTVGAAANEMGRQLRQWFGERVLGPDKPAIARVKNMSIRKIVVKLENGLPAARVRQYLLAAREQLLRNAGYSSLQVHFDVDPL